MDRLCFVKLWLVPAAILLGACGNPASPEPAATKPAAPAASTTRAAASPATVATPATPAAAAPGATSTATPTSAQAAASPSPAPGAAIAATSAIPAAERLATLQVRLDQVPGDFRQPIHVTHAGDGSSRLFVTEKAGRVRIVANGQVLSQAFLDISDKVGSSGNEQGLFSTAFHPRYPDDPRLFVHYTDRSGDTVIESYRASTDPNLADPASAKVLLTVDQPYSNHNGGLNIFGPDGYLYIGLGDGGGGGDPQDNAQNLGTLLGKILRLDVDGGDSYAIPSTNPFVNRSGAEPEIWALGVRNPWRFSFDSATGDLYLADVGQNAWEEVNFRPAAEAGGGNYGWDIMEGKHCYPSGTSCDQTGLILPVVEYPLRQDGNCAVTGGYVYRGQAQPNLQGIYFYGDYCSGKLWGMAQSSDGAWQNRELNELDASISSFGVDEADELYLTDLSGGRVYRLVDE